MHPIDYNSTRIVNRRVSVENYIPSVDIPTEPTDQAPYKNELVINSFSSPNAIGSAPGIYLRVGDETYETLEDHIIRIGKVIVTNDTPGSTNPTVSYKTAVGDSDLLETGELWFRTTDQSFFVHDGTKFVRVSAVPATEEDPGIIRIGTAEEVIGNSLRSVAVTPNTLEAWKEANQLLSRREHGYTLYVDQTLGDDSLANDGLDSYHPYLTIERALLEVALRSYRAGLDNDLYRAVTVSVLPGQYTLDNRPGLDNLEELYVHEQGDSGPINPIDTEAVVVSYNAVEGYLQVSEDLRDRIRPNTQIFNSTGSSAVVDSIDDSRIYIRLVRGRWLSEDAIIYPNYSIYNSTTGGVIVPRGCSLIGTDVRKCLIKPRYIGDLEAWKVGPQDCTCSSDGLTARFKMTGGSLLSNLTFIDSDLELQSHHLLVAAEFASTLDITDTNNGYYLKIAKSLSKIFTPPLVEAEFQENPLEYSIVTTAKNRLDLDEQGYNAVNVVSGSSPYISNCTLLSRFGAKGLRVDGSVVSGFPSFVVERFTNISLQEDPEAFSPSPGAPGEKVYKESWKHAGFEATNDGYAHLVSCFTICNAYHYRATHGGELSIANCFTNFGDTGFSADGHSSITLNQDQGGQLTRIVPPKPVLLEEQRYFVGVVSSSSTATRLYSNSSIDLSRIQPFELQADDYLFVESATGNEEYSCRLSEVYTFNDTLGDFFVVNSQLNEIYNNLSSVVGLPIYIKRIPDLRAPDDRIYWVQIEEINGIDKRAPQTNYVLRLDSAQFQGSQPSNTLFIAAVRDRDTNGTPLGKGTYQVALLTSNPRNEALDDIYPQLSTNTPDPNPGDSLTYIATRNLLTAAGVSSEQTHALLQPSQESIPITLTDNSLLTAAVEFVRPSTIRAFGTGMEWVGYGNYNSALPKYQYVTLDSIQALRKIKEETNGGRVYNVGMTQDGEFILGDKVIDLRTGEEKTAKSLNTEDTQVIKNLIVGKSLKMYPNSSLDLSYTSVTIDNQTRFVNPITQFAKTYATTTTAGFVQLATPTDRVNPYFVVTAERIGNLQNDQSFYSTTSKPGFLTTAALSDLDSYDKAFTPAAAALLPDQPQLYSTINRAGFIKTADLTDLTSEDKAFTPAAAALLPDQNGLYASTARAGFITIAPISDLNSNDKAFTPAAAAALPNVSSLYATTSKPGFITIASTNDTTSTNKATPPAALSSLQSTVNSQINNLDGRINGLQNSVSSLQGSVSSLGSSIGLSTSATTDLNNSLSGLASDLNALEGRVSNLEAGGTTGSSTPTVDNGDTTSTDPTAGIIPLGGIVMWSGSQIPGGWSLCNGSNGTPDLRGRFIVGSGGVYTINGTTSTYTLGSTGGTVEVELPQHDHTVDLTYTQETVTRFSSADGTNTSGISGLTSTQVVSMDTDVTAPNAANESLGLPTTYTTSEAGENASTDNRPPYYVLAYIMRTA